MQIVSVDQITGYIKDLLESDALLSELWIRGEVTSLFESAAGHLYLTLSDRRAKLKCVMFRGNRRGQLYQPQHGDQILAHGNVSVYESNGEYQLYVDDIAPDGAGILQLEFERLFRLLEGEGLFATERKRSLPAYPSAIGVVTSAQGAVWHDIQNVVQRRFPLAELILAPSQVQGDLAAASLIAGLQALQEDGQSEVIIIGRGGGSPEDLACFNNEQLARAIYASKIPVVSAVGHETDLTIADFVADVRAPTPSSAAELVVPNRSEILETINDKLGDARLYLEHRISDHTHRQQAASRELLRVGPGAQLDRYRQDLDAITVALTTQIANIERQKRVDIEAISNRLELLNPNSVLQRGYAVVQVSTGAGSLRVVSAEQARKSKAARIWFKDGSVDAAFTGET